MMNKRITATTGAILVALFALCCPSLNAGDIKVDGKFVSTATTGTPPLEVASTTQVANLNADTVDGFQGSDFYTVSELATSGSAMVHFDNITEIPTGGGVKEINQECATMGGCFAGDFGSFPVTITEPGSYRLTSNLDVRAEANPEDRHAVDIGATANVTVDLNGFAIIGPTACTGFPVTSCAPVGTGVGVRATNASVTISNGTVRGMGGGGVACNGCVVRNVQASENGIVGIQVADVGGLVESSTAWRNGGSGILINTGISRGNVVLLNNDYGIFANPGSVVSGNVVTENGGNGIRCAACLVLDNSVYNNEGFGLELSGSGLAYGRNLSVNNDSGAITGSGGLQVDLNLCETTACP